MAPVASIPTPSDATMLASMIDRVLIDISLRQKMITDGREYVERFTPKRLARDLSAVYENVLLTYE